MSEIVVKISKRQLPNSTELISVAEAKVEGPLNKETMQRLAQAFLAAKTKHGADEQVLMILNLEMAHLDSTKSSFTNSAEIAAYLASEEGRKYLSAIAASAIRYGSEVALPNFLAVLVNRFAGHKLIQPHSHPTLEDETEAILKEAAPKMMKKKTD